MNKVIKGIVVVLIILGIGGVWLLKNTPWENEVIKPQDLMTDGVQEEGNKEDIPESKVASETNIVEDRKDEPVINDVAQSKNEEDKVTTKVQKKEEESEKKEEKVAFELPENSDSKTVITELEENNVEESVALEISENEEITPKEIVTPELIATEFNLVKLKEYHLPIVIEFGASWCTWCRFMEPTLEQLNQEYAGRVIVQSVDVEKFYKEVGDFDVSLLPTIYFFDAKGNVVETHVGAMEKQDIVNILEGMGVKND